MAEVRKPCRTCPWWVGSSAADIPNYSPSLAEGLRSTCSGEFGAAIFACHQSVPEQEVICAGWLARYGWDSIAIRIKLITGQIGPEGLDPQPGWAPLYETFDDMIAQLRATTEEIP